MIAQIWYMRPEWFRNGISYQKPDPKNLSATHIHLLDLELEGEDNALLEEVFREMQGESWSPNGQGRELIASKGLQHTSMSVGDVIVVGDAVHLVASFGFTILT